MKKLLLALFALSAAHVFAQLGEPRNTLAFGVNAGLAMNQIGFTPSIKQGWHIGPTVGATFRITSEKYFKLLCALQVELNFTQLGWKEQIQNSRGEPIADRYRRDMSYIEMPFLARLSLGREQRGLMGYLIAGPQIGFLIGERSHKSATWTLDAEGRPDRPNGLSAQYDMSADHKFDYGIAAGLGVELNSKAGHFMLEGRYYYGLSDIWKNDKRHVFSRSNNGTLAIKLTYLFDLKKN